MNISRLMQFIGLMITIIAGCAVLYAQQAVTIERQEESGRKLEEIKTTLTQLTNETKSKNDDQDKEIVKLKIFLGLQ